MRFKQVVIAAVVLSLASTAALAAYTVADTARDEAAQQTIERNDSLAVEPGIRQALVADDDHDPSRYGDSITVVYNGTEWQADGNYTYYQSDGEIEFSRDEPGEADIDYRYEIPEDQVADEQLQTATRGFGNSALLVVAFSFIIVFLFLGAFVAQKIGLGDNRQTRGR